MGEVFDFPKSEAQEFEERFLRDLEESRRIDARRRLLLRIVGGLELVCGVLMLLLTPSINLPTYFYIAQCIVVPIGAVAVGVFLLVAAERVGT